MQNITASWSDRQTIGGKSCQKGALNMTAKTLSAKPSPAKGLTPSQMSPEDFAVLGEGDVAYLKTLSFDEIRRLFPQVEGLKRGQTLFALVGADGAPLALADTRGAALANAFEHDLKMVALH